MKRVSTRESIEFERLRDLYKKQIEEISGHFKEETVDTSVRASIEEEGIESFVAMGWNVAPSTDGITERQVRQCIEDYCQHSVAGEKLYLVHQAVKNVAMNSSTAEAEDRLSSLKEE